MLCFTPRRANNQEITTRDAFLMWCSLVQKTVLRPFQVMQDNSETNYIEHVVYSYGTTAYRISSMAETKRSHSVYVFSPRKKLSHLQLWLLSMCSKTLSRTDARDYSQNQVLHWQSCCPVKWLCEMAYAAPSRVEVNLSSGSNEQRERYFHSTFIG